MYFVYIVECVDGTLYTGITTDVQRRVEEHNNSEKGAKYTRTRRPVRVVYEASFPSRSIASKREYQIKHTFSRQQKLRLIKEYRDGEEHRTET